MKDTNIIYGRNALVDLLNSSKAVEKVFIQSSLTGGFEIKIRAMCKKDNIPLQKVPTEKLSKLCDTTRHQGIAAIISDITYYELEDILPELIMEDKAPLLLVLDGVEDVRNFGAIARSAAAYGVDAIIISNKKQTGATHEAIKASAGAMLNIKICRVRSLMKAVEYLQENDINVIASDLKAKYKLQEFNLLKPLAMVVGSEHKGVNRMLLKLVEKSFVLSHSNAIDSLNVSVATGIMLYEVERQRGTFS